MAIEKSYKESIEILKPSDVSEVYHKKYQSIIVTFQSKVLTGLLENKLLKVLPDRQFGSAHGKGPIYELIDRDDILFFVSPVGAPIAVGILEEIAYSMGIKNIIMFGSCGVLDKDITAGKIIVPTKAYRDEGTSYHYMPASDFVDIKNSSIVINILKNIGIDFVAGHTWTTDAFYRETQALFVERKQQGCISVEMEVSAVQAFANLRKLNFYSFIYGADNLDSSKWDKRILGSLAIEERVKFFMVAKTIATSI